MSATLDTSGLDGLSVPLTALTTRLILSKSVERRLTLYLVYNALVMQPLNHLHKAIAHPALKLRACNANQVLILSCYSLA
jgi:hypothetical protein